MNDVRSWLTAIGLESYAEAFERHRIGLHDLDDLTDEDLRELGVAIGHRKLFLRARQQGQSAVAARPEPAEPKPALAERRHATVLFCDLVDSVRLAEQIEAEDLLQVLRRYTDLCRDAVARYEGYVARVVGDGVLSYFGYPVAHENDAERAVRASLDIVRMLDKVDPSKKIPVRVRIGIATGQVIVGRLFDIAAESDRAVLGTIPNLAARLQSSAPENAIVIAPDTWRLVRHKFVFESLGVHQLKGFAQPVHIRQVLGELAGNTAAGHPLRPSFALTPLVDREVERRRFGELWQQVRGGAGQTLVLAGEAGIGKSRLVASFVGTLEPRPSVRYFFCSPFLSATPLGPVFSALSEQAGLSAHDTPEEKLRKLAAAATGSVEDRHQAAAIAAWLLGIPAPPHDGLDGPPRRKREKVLQVLAQQFLGWAGHEPVVIVIEDLHWADATTLDLIERLIAGSGALPLFLVLTCREEFSRQWSQRPAVTWLDVRRLPEADSIEMMRLLAGKDLTAPVAREIVRRTDGIPLFLEEFTQSVVETLDAEPGADGPGQTFHIPATLHESLVSRLDRAGSAKELAQVASVIGRSVGRELLGAVCDLDPGEIESACEFLVEAGIMVAERGEQGQKQFAFKHALVQESAYSNLLRDRRRELHARTAAGLQRLSPELVEQHPELLAHHLTEAGNLEDALPYWLRAGRRQLELSASVEATIHLRRGLAILETLPRSAENLALRLRFLILLAPALISVKGPGTPEVEGLYLEAVDLCKVLPETQEHFPVYWGWWRVSRDFRMMQERANDMLARARGRSDDALLLQAHHCQWASHFNAGDFAGSAQHIDQGLRIYGIGDYRAHAALYGNHDAKVCGHGEMSLIHWLRGNSDRALQEERLSLDWAGSLGHAGSRSHAMEIALTLGVYRRDAARVLPLAQEFIRFAVDQGFSDPEAKGLIFRGWAKSKLGDPLSGLDDIREGMARQSNIGTTEDFPIYSCMLAETLMLDGRPDEAVEAVLRSRQEAERTGLQIWLPELWRWEAVLGRAAGRGIETAEAALATAAATARRQGARALELRALNDLVALRRETGRGLDGALEDLGRVLAAVSGGFDSDELHRAIALRKELRDAGR